VGACSDIASFSAQRPSYLHILRFSLRALCLKKIEEGTVLEGEFIPNDGASRASITIGVHLLKGVLKDGTRHFRYRFDHIPFTHQSLYYSSIQCFAWR
jgi:hypothetical protein